MISTKFYLQNSSGSVEAIIERCPQKSPYVILGDADEVFLIVDKTLVCECELTQLILFYIMSAFFSFHIQYTPGCHNVFSFLEHTLLGHSKKLPPSVSHLIASICNQ